MDEVAGKPVATVENQIFRGFSESESWSDYEDEVTDKSVTHNKGTGKLVASQ